MARCRLERDLAFEYRKRGCACQRQSFLKVNPSVSATTIGQDGLEKSAVEVVGMHHNPHAQRLCLRWNVLNVRNGAGGIRRNAGIWGRYLSAGKFRHIGS